MNADYTEAAAAPPEGEPIPIERLGLSVRSYNALKRVGLDTLQSLIGKTEEELSGIRNLGVKSAAEIVAAVERYLTDPPVEEKTGESPEDQAGEEAPEPAQALEDLRPIEALHLSVRSFNALKNAGVLTVQQLLDLSPEALAEIRNLGKKSLEELSAFRRDYVPVLRKSEYSPEKLKPLVLAAMEIPFRGLSYQEFRDALPAEASDQAVKKAIGSLIAEGELEYVDFRCYRVYPSFFRFLESYLAQNGESSAQVLRRRCAGETLEAVGRDLDLTRERVRQIQANQFQKLRQAYRKQTGLTAFDEDYYEPLYTRCELPASFWTEELMLSSQALNYLSINFKRGHQKPEAILTDPQIPVSLRYRVRSFLDRDKVSVHGKLLPKSRVELEAWALKQYAGDELSYEDFARRYNQMLEDSGLAFDEKLYITATSLRTRATHLAESMLCLWKQGERLRYYDIPSRDYTELLESLHLDSYRNTELSTLKLFRLYPELMEKYDIRDAYELHNLLRKLRKDWGLEGVSFSRQPILQFGDFDRPAAIAEVMRELAPISQQELLDYLESEFGYDRQTAVGYLTPLSAYYHNGVYIVDFPRVPPERETALKRALPRDFYFLDEIRETYSALFPQADPEQINPQSLKALGFLVNTNYALQHFPTADAYFRALLTKEDVYDVSGYLKRYGSVQMFNQVYGELLQEHRIFRFERDQIITLRRLERLRVSGETVEDYCRAVRDFAEPDAYFTIASLRREGFRHPLEDLGFGEYFYASLLGTDPRFPAQRVFGTIVLFNGGGFGRFSITDFLLSQLREYDMVSPEDFIWDLEDRFGVKVPNRWEVTAAVKDSELYYDSVMDKVYRDKSLYLADLED